MKVTMKQTVEDKHVTAKSEAAAARARGAVILSSVETQDESGNDRTHIISRLKEGESYDLPDEQAKKLIKLGYAQKG